MRNQRAYKCCCLTMVTPSPCAITKKVSSFDRWVVVGYRSLLMNPGYFGSSPAPTWTDGRGRLLRSAQPRKDISIQPMLAVTHRGKTPHHSRPTVVPYALICYDLECCLLKENEDKASLSTQASLSGCTRQLPQYSQHMVTIFNPAQLSTLGKRNPLPWGGGGMAGENAKKWVKPTEPNLHQLS